MRWGCISDPRPALDRAAGPLSDHLIRRLQEGRELRGLLDREVGWFAPLRTLSTKAGERRYISVRLVEYAMRPPISVNSGHGSITGSRFLAASSTICAWCVNAPLDLVEASHFQSKDADAGPLSRRLDFPHLQISS